ncbi:MAG TPA: hypothetical protein DCR10_03335 [Acidimicrobiaceae bacterium]|nr:hypothetical protein [Acidimicrobiaceae bacterium]
MRPARLSRTRRRLIAAASVVVVSSTAWAQPAADEADRLLASVVESDRLPSLSVAVLRDGSLVYASALGLADVENDVPATPGTAYRIGSVTKTLTAVTALQLSERGALDLDAPLQDYCPAQVDALERRPAAGPHCEHTPLRLSTVRRGLPQHPALHFHRAGADEVRR